MKKKTEEEQLPEHIKQFKKVYNRYRRNYHIIVCLWIAAEIAIGYFINLFWCAIAFCFGYWNWVWYEDGAQENCMDEYEFAYPKDGLRKMLKSWPWFAVIAIIAYFFCRRFMPYLFD